MADMKVCTKCGRELPATPEYFQRRKTSKDGLMYVCKDCRSRLRGCKRMRQSNEYIDRGDGTSYIVFYDKAGNRKPKMGLVDNEDIPVLSKRVWAISSAGYAFSSEKGNKNHKDLLHRMVMQVEDGVLVDHINHETLDNRKCNLRKCTRSQNYMNEGLSVRNTSGVRGVSYNKLRNKWIAQISLKGICHIQNKYDTFEEAVKERKRLEKEYFGEFVYGGVANG